MKVFLPILMMVFFGIGCQPKQQVDLLVYNGTIYTVDGLFTTAEAMVVDKGKIVALGKSSDLRNKYEAFKSLNLEEQFMYPGFIDPHCHFLGYGKTLTQVDLKNSKSFEEVVDRCKLFHNEMNTFWITGRGWDQNLWEDKQFPTKELLDEAFPNNPVLLRRVDGHAAVANSKALSLAKLNKNTKVEGGEIQILNGKPSGILIDKAVDLVMACIPELSKGEKVQALLSAQENCFAVGLSSVGDAGLYTSDVLLIDSLQKAGKLNMRMYAMLEPNPENIAHFVKKGKYKTEGINVQSIKLYADGALGSRGACLLEPYSDDENNYGLIVEDKSWLEEMCKLAYKHGYQVNTHCIGDSANRLMLDMYGEILEGKNDRRWRIEHAQVVNPEDVVKYGDYSIIPSIQTTHCTSDMFWATQRLGGERSQHAYAWQDLLKENSWMPNGSDFPIENINPLYGFYAGVSRKNQDFMPEQGFFPEQRLSREEALKAMTIWAAKAQFEEQEKGSLEPGKYADFVILPSDLMTADQAELYKIKVANTFVNGNQVYP